LPFPCYIAMVYPGYPTDKSEVLDMVIIGENIHVI